MRKRKNLIYTLLLLGVASPGYAFQFDFNPRIAVLGSYTYTQNFTDIREGVFGITNRKINFGLELTNKLYIFDDYFINTGLRYKQWKTMIHGKNQMPEYFNHPDPMGWEKGYESVVIPVLFGKDFFTSKGMRKGEVYLGISAGVLMTAYAKSFVQSILPINFYNRDLIRGTILDHGSMVPTYFYTSLDIGVNYQPLLALPRFKVGVMCSAQLNKTKPAYYHALEQNITKGKDYEYRLFHHQRVMDFSVMLSYTFGKQKKAVTGSSLNCPK